MAAASTGADFLERLDNLRVLRLEAAVHGDVLCGILAQEDQRVADVIGLVDRARDLLHHSLLGLGPNAGRRFDKADRHGALLQTFAVTQQTPLETSRYNHGLVKAEPPAPYALGAVAQPRQGKESQRFLRRGTSTADSFDEM